MQTTNAASTGRSPWQGCSRDGVRKPQTVVNLMESSVASQRGSIPGPNYHLELARRAATEATRAQGLTACLSCGQPATVWLVIDAIYFRAERCDPCAERVIADALSRRRYIGDRPVEIELSPMGHTNSITQITDVDLAQFAVESLDGVNHDHMVPASPNVPDAKALVVMVLEARLRRSLRPSERAAAESAAAVEARRRVEQRYAEQAETRRRLHDPLLRTRRVG